MPMKRRKGWSYVFDPLAWQRKRSSLGLLHVRIAAQRKLPISIRELDEFVVSFRAQGQRHGIFATTSTVSRRTRHRSMNGGALLIFDPRRLAYLVERENPKYFKLLLKTADLRPCCLGGGVETKDERTTDI
jgi:hypothetical protein